MDTEEARKAWAEYKRSKTTQSPPLKARRSKPSIRKVGRAALTGALTEAFQKGRKKRKLKAKAK